MNSFKTYEWQKVLKNLKKVAGNKGRTSFFFFFAIVFFMLSCEPEVEKPAEGDFSLSFSADTVFFDTLFTETRSITKRLKIYNNSSGAVTINQISLKEGVMSPFSIYINGIKGKSFDQVNLLGKDSLLILVEATIDRQDKDLPFVVEDQLLFQNSHTNKIPLIAWGQDAVFLKDTVLSCDARFLSERPYVLFGATVVDSLCTLIIDAGAKIYGHFNSGLYIRGSIKANGTAENRILFSNDRFDEGYINAPGQWRGIYVLEGSFENRIIFADIRNAEVGIRIGDPDDDDEYDLEVGHTRIENISTAGVLSFTSDVYIHNSLINNCGFSSVAAVSGGNCKFWNNTFANYSFDFFREHASMILSDNVVLADNSLLIADLKADIKNNIIWGSLKDELVISNAANEGVVDVHFSNNIIRTTTDTLSSKNLINTDPEFLAPREYDYRLDSSSQAINAGLFLPGITTDITGKSRINAPDLGAYENQ